MINRYMYCGYNNSGVEFLKNENIVTASCAFHDDMVFLYYESFGEVFPEAAACRQVYRHAEMKGVADIRNALHL